MTGGVGKESEKTNYFDWKCDATSMGSSWKHGELILIDNTVYVEYYLFWGGFSSVENRSSHFTSSFSRFIRNNSRMNFLLSLSNNDFSLPVLSFSELEDIFVYGNQILKCYYDQILEYHFFSLDWPLSTWSTWCANYSLLNCQTSERKWYSWI